MSETTPRTETARAAIAHWSPAGAAGFDRIREASDSDGALTRAEKALITAAAAAAAGRQTLVAPAVERAVAAGLPLAHAWAVAPILLLARGDEACDLYTAALLAHAGSPPAGPAQADASSASDALAYFRDYFEGTIPPRIALLAERAPVAFEGYALLHRSALRDSVLPPKLAELVLCAANAATFQTVFVEIHAEAARSVGATEDELVEAIVAAVPVSGVAAWASAAGVIR